MKPFNLERALAGDPVVTRNGKKVTQITKFDISNEFKIVCVIDDEIEILTRQGRYFAGINDSGNDSVNDLFMDTVKKQAWINIYSGCVGVMIFDSKEDADLGATKDRVACVPIEWEE